MTFKDLGLNEKIISAITSMGYETPTPIQQQAIPYLLDNSGDLIGLASTGTGKTASFGLPLIQHMDVSNKHVQGLIICPTRELCLQISRDLDDYSSEIKGLHVTAVYGGTDINKQIKTIAKGVQIIVATPGRLVDLIKRKKVKLNQVETVVLDEADEMLNMGFKDDIDFILDQTPEEKSVWLFSATMPKEVARIAKNYMEDPFEITVGGKNEGNKNISHQVYTVKDRDKYNALKRILDYNPEIYGLVFCRTRRDTANVADKLMADGYNAEPLHGDLSQAQRDRVMEKFRNKSIQILVATDVAARGIDVDNITHVIHYSLPEDVENYTHRSGRTARAGREGISAAIITAKEARKVKAIERIIKSKFETKSVPKADDICEKQLFNLVDKMTEVEVQASEIEKYMPQVMEKLGEFSKEEIISKFVSAEINRFLNYYANAKDINVSFEKASNKYGDEDYHDSDQQRFFVNLGRKDGFNQGALLRLVCDNSGVSKKKIGKIDILNNFSFFEADKDQTDILVKSLQNIDFDGNLMNVEVTKSQSKGGGKRRGSSRGGFKGNHGKSRNNNNGSGRRSRSRSYKN